MAVVARRLAAQSVDCAVSRRGDDPAGWAGRHAIDRPPFSGNGERVLYRLLGHVDVAERAHQDGDGAPVLRAEDLRDLRRGGWRAMGRLGGAVRHRTHVGDRGAARVGDGAQWVPSSSWNGRTSIGSESVPSLRTAPSLRAHARAPSRSGARTTRKPPTCSLPSAYGPSVISTCLPCRRTTVAVLGSCRPPLNTHAPASLASWTSAFTLA